MPKGGREYCLYKGDEMRGRLYKRGRHSLHVVKGSHAGQEVLPLRK